MTATSLVQAVATVIAAAGDGDLSGPYVVREVRRQYPDVCAQIATAAVDFRIGREFKRQMRPRDEQPCLPGFDYPSRIPVATEGGFIWRHAGHATLDEHDSYVRLLGDQIRKDVEHFRRLRREARRIRALCEQYGVVRLDDLPDGVTA